MVFVTTGACGPVGVASMSDELVPSTPIENLYPQELKMISSVGTVYSRNVIAKKMAPRGSAVITSSGDLAKQGITQIVHAATGSSAHGLGPKFEPTLESVANSVKNSMILAKRYGHKTIAIPFIGGNIFLGRIGTTREKLAETIVRAALEECGTLQLRLITYSSDRTKEGPDTTLFKSKLAQLLSEARFKNAGSNAQVIQGGITDFSLHQASVIVNAANMEVRFGGGISGAIAGSTGDSIAIDDEAASAVAKFNQRALESFDKN